jgi:hypothetical protein
VIYPLKKNTAGKMSGAQNMATSLTWMPAVPVPGYKKIAAVVMLP